MGPEKKYFKCSKCQYILETENKWYGAGCPMCNAYMVEVDESDPQVKRFISTQRKEEAANK